MTSRPRPEPVLRFLAAKLAQLGCTVLLTTFLAFLAWQVVVPDPAALVLKGDAQDRGTADAQVLAQIRERFGFDDPILEQYGRWLVSALHGDFGVSYDSGQSVRSILLDRLPVSLFLAGYAAVLVLTIGIFLGTVAAYRQGSRVDSNVTGVLAVVSVLPEYILGMVLVSVFVLAWGWFPSIGAGESFADRLWHLTLPAIVLASGWLARLASITRASIVAESGAEHVWVSRSRGLAESLVRRRHITRNAVVPVLSVTAFVLGSLLVGSAVVEALFGLDGIGKMTVEAAASQDIPVIQAMVLITTLLFVLLNLSTDVAQSVLDPRTRDEVFTR